MEPDTAIVNTDTEDVSIDNKSLLINNIGNVISVQ